MVLSSTQFKQTKQKYSLLDICNSNGTYTTLFNDYINTYDDDIRWRGQIDTSLLGASTVRIEIGYQKLGVEVFSIYYAPIKYTSNLYTLETSNRPSFNCITFL
jgi:hypothetical protein